MLNQDRQREAQEALRRLDEALTADAALEEAVQQNAHELRDQLFGAFQFIERESLQLKTLFVQTRRLEANMLQVQARGRPPLALYLDAELAYDHKVPPQTGASGHGELCARLYALFAPPYQGVLRCYTIFASGEWKRTVFISRAGTPQAHHIVRPAINQDALLEEAADLLAQSCAVHPSWASLNDNAAATGLDQLRDRQFVRRDPLGLG